MSALEADLFGTEEAPTVAKATTPSGIVIEYESAPKRRYLVNGVEVPSVTTILKCLDKPALPWWGMKVGVEGVLTLVNDGLRLTIGEEIVKWSVEEIVDLLTKNKLTVNHVRDKAASRGMSVHDAFESWARDPRFLPAPDHYPESERGYVVGLLKFLTESQAKPVACEVMVGSAGGGYAGRYDVELRFNEDLELVKRRTPTGRETRVPVAAGTWLADLKTSKNVYDSHFLQLAGYEDARVECGYEPTVGQGVLKVTEDGWYEFVPSPATPLDFAKVVETYYALEELKERRKAA